MTNFAAFGHLAKAIERVLELSADAQIQRREAALDSPAFHRSSGAIATYGKVLRILTRLQRLEDEQYLVIGQFERIETSASAIQPL